MRELIIGLGTALVLTWLTPQSEAGEIHLLPFNVIQEKCQSQIAWEHIKRAAEGKPKTRLIANGCYISTTGDVYVRNDLSPSRTREVIRHELKHKDGWRH